jgi:hypothetical protein
MNYLIDSNEMYATQQIHPTNLADVVIPEEAEDAVVG